MIKERIITADVGLKNIIDLVEIITLWIRLHGGRGIQMTSPARQSNHLCESRGEYFRCASSLKTLILSLDLVQSNPLHFII